MTDKRLSELHVGDWIADMHYGEQQLRERFDVVIHVRWDEPSPTRRDKELPSFDGYARHAFFRYLGQLCGDCCNKFLYVIGFTDDSTLTNPKVIAAYCYDGIRSGIVVLQDKPHGDVRKS